MSILVIVLPLIVLGVILAIVAATRSGRPIIRSGETVCGQCGYNVRGLSTFTCPECGSDLREVGIISPTAKNETPSNLWWQIVLLTIGCLLLMMLFATLFKQSGSTSSTGSIGMLATLIALIWIGGIIFLVYWKRRKQSSGTFESTSPPKTFKSRTTQQAQPEEQRQRTTAVLTIMFIDMQDYTAQTSTHSRLELAELVQRLRDVVSPYAQRRNGNIVKSLGDGLLLTFASPTEALLGGREIQQDAKKVELPALRIGVSTGEVSMFTDDVLGEPVNLAARIETLAEPGHVYFSEATFHAMTRSEVPHEPAGEFEIKGLDGLRTVYRVI